MVSEQLLAETIDWLRVPSISAGQVHPAQLARAASWAVDRVCRAGGAAELVQIGSGHPLVVGELRSEHPDPPTVLIYGH